MRCKTKYPGVVYRMAKRIGGNGEERVYYVRFKRDGNVIEAKAGRQYADDMSPAKAAHIRGEFIEGKRETPQEIRRKKAEKIWTIDALREAYFAGKPDGKSKYVDINRYDNYLKPTLAKKKPEDIKPLDVERIRRKSCKGKSLQTIKHVLTLLKRIVNYGVKQNLCKGISFHIELPKLDNKVTEDLTPDQLKSLLKVLHTHKNKDVANILRLALLTGMRRGEIFKLTWDDLDFHNKMIHIRNPKGGQSAKIPMNPEAERLLSSIKKHLGSPYVFPAKDGRHRVSIARAANDIRTKAGLPKAFRMCHGLRHTYASMLASSGQVDMFVLQKLLTHKSPQMTQRYAHLRDEALRNGANVAGNIIGGIKTKRKKIASMKP